ncbi:PepSY-associated TM helix domain-containing protein [Caballeronia sp. RCC_10]|uniref:PepSY-associated TM helix domain-containing protein n=1 Tax=Caballeronia sp. RCC_10 TaxID=3239227 RepID=UPI003524B771
MHAPQSTLAESDGDVIAERRTLWRWHFYAGLFVMPLLIVLAITGTLYCFQPQIEPMLYRDRMIVADTHAPRLSQDALLAKAIAAAPRDAVATLAQIETDPTRSAEFVFRLPSGESESVYVNPYDGAVLGTLSVEHRLMKQIRNLHRGLMLGKTGELLMELAGCWTLVMIGTGVALWWPWGRASRRLAGVWLARLSLEGRAWWRDLHAVGGVWLAIGALFFVLSGLPWSNSWGKQFKALATSASLGYPKGAWGEAHVHSTAPGKASPEGGEHAMHGMGMKMDDLPLHQTPWAVGATAVPDSAGHAAAPRVPLGDVVTLAAKHGIADDYGIALPSSPTGVYTVSYFPADPQAERTLHIDQYTGRVLSDISYQSYGAIAQVISYGTSLHMGRYFGMANQIICSAISLGLAALSVTGFVMWLKRRPSRTLGAPSRPARRPPMRAWRGGLALVGVVFPLMGATMLAVWCLDRLAFGRRSGAQARA